MMSKYYKLLKELQKIDGSFEIQDAITYKILNINNDEEIAEAMEYFKDNKENEKTYCSLEKLKSKNKTIKNNVFAVIIREKIN